MCRVCVHGLVSFSANNGVCVEPAAEYAPGDAVLQALRIAWMHYRDPILVDACCGRTGPLAHYAELDIAQYLELKKDAELQAATLSAKAQCTRQRRQEFNGRRAGLVLAMIDAGIPYRCAQENCSETTDLTVDHRLALSRGGTDELPNLRFMCRSHNATKGTSGNGPG